MNHTQKIQQLIDECGYKSFLEIGYGKGNNFNAIEVKDKVAVDPEVISGDPKIYRQTSDEFFNEAPPNKKWDIILIDGLHLADQVERDIVNAYRHLKKGGVILVHDVWPGTEAMTIVPRKQREWTGDTYRAWDGLVQAFPELKTSLIHDDYGIGIIEYTPNVKIEPGFVSDISYDEYKAKYA